MSRPTPEPLPDSLPEESQSAEPTDCASRLKLLADPTRLSVLRQLLDEPRKVGEIQAELGIEQSLLSHHLRVLREAGLVATERDGKAIRYRLAADVRRGPDESLHLGCCHLVFDSPDSPDQSGTDD